ncbi:helix-turn-helix domain-containing protein [Paenibacillus sp. PsM32]|uniref:helix-turn-helix domain-containing protein n=1 Tax=Paenibacillus sp. PsM32 TaxID=3030536 RepID=UPI00263AE18B|nr:helix-turn-helix domain-containing protein [Paenibacillus sp. PsM32]MDN4621095.1 helix-turn-helix domain-containing protein [Paenibacillus sp. PsM32]
MIDSHRVGAKIADYRKQKNLTQIELANLVNVTPQAVSKWEQGKCYPDIFTFLKLSRIFNFDINKLLEEPNLLHSELLKNLTPEDEIVLENLKISDIVDYAIVIKPNKINEILKQYDLEKLSLPDLFKLMPFVEQDLLMQLLKPHWDKIVDDLYLLARVAPFVTEEWMYTRFETENNLNLESILKILKAAPYFNSKAKKYIYDNFSDITIEEIQAFLPFLDDREIQVFVQEHIDEYINNDKLVTVLPFLNDEFIRCVLLNKSLSIETIISIAALIPESVLITLLQNYNGYLNTSDLLTFSFLVDEKILTQIREISKSKQDGITNE